MVMRDLDILGDKSEDTLVLFGKERRIARLKVKDYVTVQELMTEMTVMVGKSGKEIDEVEKKAYPLFKKFIPDLTRKEYDDMNLSQKMAVFNYVDELFLIDQGIPEDQVVDIKKRIETERMNILLQNIGKTVNTD